MSLYRKYRPQSFADFINQKPIKLTITNQIARDLTVHAYLFTGPRGVGKTTMARLMAKALNCKNRAHGDCEPCNECSSCQEIQKGTSLDIVEMDAASNRGIDEIRTLKERVRYAPGGEKYKVFIIDEAHMLTTPAWNALLKTLEEPPKNALFILATTEAHKLPDTIISRCQRFDFKRIRREEIAGELKNIAKKEGFAIPDDIIETIAIRSEGGMRDALSTLGQIITVGGSPGDNNISWDEAELVIPRGNRELVNQFIESLKNKNSKEAMQIINKLSDEGIDFDQFILDLLEVLQEQMHRAVNSEENPELFVRFIDIFLDRYEDIKQVTFLPQLPLEVGALQCINDFPKNFELSSGSDSTEKQTTPIHENKAQVEQSYDITQVLEKWQDIAERAKVYNNSLPVALSFCKPVRFEANVLVLGFKFKLHENIVSHPRNRNVLETLIAEILGHKVVIKGEVIGGWEGSHEEEETGADVMQNVKDIFGAE